MSSMLMQRIDLPGCDSSSSASDQLTQYQDFTYKNTAPGNGFGASEYLSGGTSGDGLYAYDLSSDIISYANVDFLNCSGDDCFQPYSQCTQDLPINGSTYGRCDWGCNTGISHIELTADVETGQSNKYIYVLINCYPSFQGLTFCTAYGGGTFKSTNATTTSGKLSAGTRFMPFNSEANCNFSSSANSEYRKTCGEYCNGDSHCLDTCNSNGWDTGACYDSSSNVCGAHSTDSCGGLKSCWKNGDCAIGAVCSKGGNPCSYIAARSGCPYSVGSGPDLRCVSGKCINCVQDGNHCTIDSSQEDRPNNCCSGICQTDPLGPTTDGTCVNCKEVSDCSARCEISSGVWSFGGGTSRYEPYLIRCIDNNCSMVQYPENSLGGYAPYKTDKSPGWALKWFTNDKELATSIFAGKYSVVQAMGTKVGWRNADAQQWYSFPDSENVGWKASNRSTFCLGCMQEMVNNPICATTRAGSATAAEETACKNVMNNPVNGGTMCSGTKCKNSRANDNDFNLAYKYCSPIQAANITDNDIGNYCSSIYTNVYQDGTTEASNAKRMAKPKLTELPPMF